MCVTMVSVLCYTQGVIVIVIVLFLLDTTKQVIFMEISKLLVIKKLITTLVVHVFYYGIRFAMELHQMNFILPFVIRFMDSS